MNLQQLKTVCEITRHRFSMSAAAAILHRSQPALSRQVSELEKEMGVRIFSRTRNKIVGLTPEGQEVLAIGQRITRELDALRQVGAGVGIGTAELRIATTHTHARYSLPRVIKSFTEQSPNVLLNLQQGDPLQCCQLVAEGEVDIGITTEPDRLPRDIVTIPAYKLSRSVLAPKGHPICRGKLTLQRIAEYPIIAYTRSPYGRWIFGEAFTEAGLKPRIALSAIDADVSKTYIALGMGIAVLASTSYDPVQDRQLVAVDADHLFRPGILALVFRRGSYVSRHAHAFLAIFAPHIASEIISRSVDGTIFDRHRLARNAPYASNTIV
jgi:LysR family cys regulon transcriptional activator